MKQAAVMLIIKNGLILGVSRRDNPNIFGLPGGKCEPKESFKEAAIRETKEETGITVKSCALIFQRKEDPITPDGLPFYTFCFYALDWEGSPRSSEEGVVEWLYATELTTPIKDGGKGAFSEYNTLTLKAFKTLFPNVIISSDPALLGKNKDGK